MKIKNHHNYRPSPENDEWLKARVAASGLSLNNVLDALVADARTSKACRVLVVHPRWEDPRELMKDFDGIFYGLKLYLRKCRSEFSDYADDQLRENYQDLYGAARGVLQELLRAASLFRCLDMDKVEALQRAAAFAAFKATDPELRPIEKEAWRQISAQMYVLGFHHDQKWRDE